MEAQAIETKPLITLIGQHRDHGYLGYLQEGDVETDAIVEVDDPFLLLAVPKEYIETGNALIWISPAELELNNYNLDTYYLEQGVREPSQG